MIRDGRIAEPITANTIRINDNIATFLNNVAGVTKDVKGTIVWAADEVVYAPEIAVTDVRGDAIARGEAEGGAGPLRQMIRAGGWGTGGWRPWRVPHGV